MNDHNLDDLIIDTIEPNHSKTKSFLTIIALLIVFLIVGIILTKIYTKESHNDTLTLEENNSEMIAPELKLQAPSKVVKVKEETTLSTIIEHEVKAPEIKNKEVVPVQKPTNPPLTQEVVQTTKETVQITQKQQEPKISKPVIKEKESQTPIVNSVAPKPLKTAVTPKEIRTMNSDAAYYIQVGSFTQEPSKRFLSIIKNSGFNHTITKSTSKGIKKLLIGPYTSRAAVDKALIQVRDRINKSAFVVKR